MEMENILVDENESKTAAAEAEVESKSPPAEPDLKKADVESDEVAVPVPAPAPAVEHENLDENKKAKQIDPQSTTDLNGTLAVEEDDVVDDLPALETAFVGGDSDADEDDPDSEPQFAELTSAPHSKSDETREPAVEEEEDDVDDEYDDDEKSVSEDDDDDDEDEEEETPYDEEEPEDSDSDVQIIQDSSPEKSQHAVSQLNTTNEDFDDEDDDEEEEDEDDYDDDDLMNDVVSSSRRDVPVPAKQIVSNRKVGIKVSGNRGAHKNIKRRMLSQLELRRRASIKLSIKRLTTPLPKMKAPSARISQISRMAKLSVQEGDKEKNHTRKSVEKLTDCKDEKEEVKAEPPAIDQEQKSLVFNPFATPRKSPSSETVQVAKAPVEEAVVDLQDASEQNKENVQCNEKEEPMAVDEESTVKEVEPEKPKESEPKDALEDGTKVVEEEAVDVTDKKTEDQPDKVASDPAEENEKKEIQTVPEPESKAEEKPTLKRRRSENSEATTDAKDPTSLEKPNPSKKLRAELDDNFEAYDSILSKYMSKVPNDSLEHVQNHMANLMAEIDALDEMIEANEMEWRKMLHLKKMKEQIVLRLSRKKQTIEMLSSKLGEVDAHSPAKNQSKMATKTSTPLMNPANATNLFNLTGQAEYSEQLNSTALLSGSASSIINNRASMQAADLAKEKANAQKVHRNILPKPSKQTAPLLGGANHTNSVSSSNLQPILNSYLTSAQLQDQMGELLNGHHNSNATNGGQQQMMVGRQGMFKDVKSIIAEYKQSHPETVPRRGRRVKVDSILGNALKSDHNSRPSSNDSSSHSLTNAINNISAGSGNLNFQNVFSNIAKMNNQQQRVGAATALKTPLSAGGQAGVQSYPEVTLHPVTNQQFSSNTEHAGSLLQRILSLTDGNPNKPSTAQVPTTSTYGNNFSPTLARLLTTHERMNSLKSQQQQLQQQQPNPTHSYQMQSPSGINLAKVVGPNNEITITPVMSSRSQKDLKMQDKLKEIMEWSEMTKNRKADNCLNMDDEAEDSVDRLVIDESGDTLVAGGDEQGRNASHALGQEFVENEVPVCQGCKKFEAQFVCAGCSNQWYCSRDCQVTAWDEHSDVCTG